SGLGWHCAVSVHLVARGFPVRPRPEAQAWPAPDHVGVGGVRTAGVEVRVCWSRLVTKTNPPARSRQAGSAGAPHSEAPRSETPRPRSRRRAAAASGEEGSPSGTSPRRTYVLDTSVLLADPAAVLRFGEHDVVHA